MKVHILSKNANKVEFVVEGANAALANSLRRTMINNVPTLAVDWVDIHDNTSALFDEVIAHRVGLIPLSFKPGDLNNPEDCECNGKGCPSCQVVFVIDAKGPCTVMSGDMKSSAKGIKPSSPDIPIVKLLDGHNVKLEAIARMGIGKSHARHQAASAAYQYYPSVSFKGSAADAAKAAKSCPRGALKANGTKLELAEPDKCNLCRCCMESAEGVKLEGDDTKFIFRVESICGLPPEQIVLQAADVLINKAKDLKEHVQKL